MSQIPDGNSRSTVHTRSDSGSSHGSYQTYNSTVSSQSPRSKPNLQRGSTFGEYAVHGCSYDPRESAESYASTVPSDDEDDFEYEVEEFSDSDSGSLDNGVLASTPVEFGELFPSNRRLTICHDDTVDGNMNLRIDTLVKMRGGERRPFTLFHLRMRDLATRDFSLRRYCRDSGREVCNSIRKYQSPNVSRPTLQRSVSTLANFFKNSNHEAGQGPLKRSDSGYESVSEEDLGLNEKVTQKHDQKPTDDIVLEFSNYAHVNVKKRKNNGVKRWGFEYWGSNYAWKRVVQRADNRVPKISYILLKNGSKTVLASITPDDLDDEQKREEELKKGWIPQSTFRLYDQSIIAANADVADAVVSTGLMALVDDNIRRKAKKQNQSKGVVIMLPRKTQTKMEFVGPKRFIGEVFGRKNSGLSSPIKA
jgi:hypothetical protein